MTLIHANVSSISISRVCCTKLASAILVQSRPLRTAARCSTVTSGFSKGEAACEPARLDRLFQGPGASLGSGGPTSTAAAAAPPDSGPRRCDGLASAPKPEVPLLSVLRPAFPSLRGRRRATARHTSSFAVDPAAPPTPPRHSAAAQVCRLRPSIVAGADLDWCATLAVHFGVMHDDVTMCRAGTQRRLSSGAAASQAATSTSQSPCYLRAATSTCPSRCSRTTIEYNGAHVFMTIPVSLRDICEPMLTAAEAERQEPCTRTEQHFGCRTPRRS